MQTADNIKQLRKQLELTQTAFGERLGVSRNVVNNLELGRVDPSDLVIKSICREFNVNSLWLLEGKGEMFSGYADDLIQSVAEEYNLNNFDVDLIRAYLDLDKYSRRVIMDFIKKTQPE